MFKTLSVEQIESLDNILEKLMQGCYEENGKKLCKERLLDTQWLDSTVQRWCELQRKRVLKTMSKALDVFTKEVVSVPSV